MPISRTLLSALQADPAIKPIKNISPVPELKEDNSNLDEVKQWYQNNGFPSRTEIEEFNDGFSIVGKKEIAKNTTLETHLDHRLAMSYYVLGLINNKKTAINGFDCINTSFPEFIELMNKLF